MSDFHKELKFLVSAVYAAADVALNSKHFEVQEKEENDFITTCDTAVEKFLIDKIRAEYPNDLILSEETRSGTIPTGRTWVLDPIDGTRNFVVHSPLYAIQCALMIDDIPVVSVIYLPVFNKMFYAERGFGAYMDSQPLQVKDVPLKKASVVYSGAPVGSDDKAIEEAVAVYHWLEKNVAMIYKFGSIGVAAAYLAAGMATGIVSYTTNLWDAAPAFLLCKEAGCRIRSLDGGYILGKSPAIVMTAGYQISIPRSDERKNKGGL